jgi:membrane associated rhomboid family serine protease
MRGIAADDKGKNCTGAGGRTNGRAMLPLFDTQKQKRTPVMTGLLILANLAVFGYQVWLWLDPTARPGGLETFMREYSLVPRRLLGNPAMAQWETVFTSMFLHGGVAHVLGNCWFLWVFGPKVEDRLGSFQYLGFYLVCGVGAALAQVVVDPGAAVPMLGASGAISGVLGAYFVMFPTAWIYALVPWIVPILPVPAVLFLLLWFLLQTVNGVGALMAGAIGGVAWWAHFGGFITGMVLVAVIKRTTGLRR